MNLKQYQRLKLVIVVVVAMVFSQAVIYRSFIIPIGVLVASVSLLLLARRKVDEIIADERDYHIGGQSAMLAIQIFAWVSVVAMTAFYALRDSNPAYEPIGFTLAYSTMTLMLLYSLIFYFKSKFKFSTSRIAYLVFVLILFALLAVFGLRLFSGEDNWICRDGQWIRHGHPSFPSPAVQCE